MIFALIVIFLEFAKKLKKCPKTGHFLELSHQTGKLEIFLTGILVNIFAIFIITYLTIYMFVI